MDKRLLEKLKAAFRVEAAEYLALMQKALVDIPETVDAGKDFWLENSFRAMHSLKGASRAVNQGKVERICMAAESFFSHLRKSGRLPSADEVEILHAALHGIENLVEDGESISSEEIDKIVLALETEAVASTSSTPADSSLPSAEIKPDDAPEPSHPDPTPAAIEKTAGTADLSGDAEQPARREASIGDDGIRVSQSRLTQVMREIEELTRVKLATQFQAERLEMMAEKMLKLKRVSNGIDPLLNRLDKLSNDLEGTIGSQVRAEVHKLWNQHEEMQMFLEPMESMVETSREEGVQQALGTSRIVDALGEELRELLLVPMSEGLLVLGKITRDLSRDQSKLIDLKVTGDAIEIDRRILDAIKDPFIHLIRNAVDHGIETPEERERLNKPKRGTIEINIEQSTSGKVSILFSDDGRGLDLDRLRTKLVAENGFSQEEVLSMDERDLADHIFNSGVSTAAKVTDISGRGLGMSIVREKIEAVDGSVGLAKAPRGGMAFAIELPILQATFRGIIIRIGKQEFVFPTRLVESVQRVEPDAVKTVRNKSTFLYEGHAMPIHSLASLIGLDAEGTAEGAPIQVVVLQWANRRLAAQVDVVVREQEVLVKSLGPQLANAAYFSGVAITGTGRPALIFNTGEIIKAAVSKGTRPIRVEVRDEKKPRKKRVLIAEDSFTSRMLLKNVLESASYEVESAEDGAAAFAILKTGEFDLLVSDVDMPRMNGFVLTERVRNDRRLGTIPIVLITSLATPEDKERGIDAGASAYIVKSNFDQGDLLATLERLIGAVES